MGSDIGGRGSGYWGLDPKLCDSCRASPAILFCRADSAFLCGACDGRVHSANKLASRHERVSLCEVCEHAPASVTCKADAAALCVSCDSDIHSANPLAHRHERLPVVPFFDSPFAKSDGAAFLLKPHDVDGEVDLKSADYFFADADPYLDLGDYADSVVPVRSNTVLDAPPPPHPHLPPLDYDFAASHPSYSTYSVCSSEVGVVPDVAGDVSTGGGGCVSGRSGNQTATSGGGMTAMDREARVMRYREKRKNRRFEKTIRYASRKAYAETRPRIKGRFAKRTEVEAEAEMMVYSSAGIVVPDGVVPSF